MKTLNIKDPEAHRLAAAIAQETGETMTHVVTDALRDQCSELCRALDGSRRIAWPGGHSTMRPVLPTRRDRHRTGDGGTRTPRPPGVSRLRQRPSSRRPELRRLLRLRPGKSHRRTAP